MSRMVSIDEQHLIDIANHLREKSGNNRTYTPGQMAQAIRDLPTCRGEEILLNLPMGHYYNPRVTTFKLCPNCTSLHLPRVIEWPSTILQGQMNCTRLDLKDITSIGTIQTGYTRSYFGQNLTTLILRGNTVCQFNEDIAAVDNSKTVAITEGCALMCMYDENGNRIPHQTSGEFGYIYVPAALLADYEAAYPKVSENRYGGYEFRAIEDYPDICNYPEYLQEAN